MASINTKLEQWLEENLITQNQVDAIRTFEAEHTSGRRAHWWLYSLLILGAGIIGLGVISLIAANWAAIPDGIKLGANFLLLTGVAAGIYKQYHQPSDKHLHSPWFDVLTAGFLVLCLASIGLISQIFHISGHWYHALLFWGMITFPLVLFSQHLFVRFFWVTLALHGLIWSIVGITSDTLDRGFEEIPAVILFAPLLTAVLYTISKHVRGLSGFNNSLFFWFQIAAIAALVVADIAHSGGDFEDYQLTWYLPAYTAAALLAAGIIINPQYRTLNKTLLLTTLILLLLYYHPTLLFTGETRYSYYGAEQSVSFWQANDLRAPVITIVILFLYALHAGNSGHQRTFNLVTFLIGLRFVILYFQALGGLAATGIGLIVSGLLIIGIAWAWYTWRERLQHWTRGLQL